MSTITYNGTKYKCSAWLKGKIKTLMNNKHRSPVEELELLMSYKSAIHAPFYYGELSDDEKKINSDITRVGVENNRQAYIQMKQLYTIR